MGPCLPWLSDVAMHFMASSSVPRAHRNFPDQINFRRHESCEALADEDESHSGTVLYKAVTRAYDPCYFALQSESVSSVMELTACLNVTVMLMAMSASALAGGGPLGIDHEWRYGIWARHFQLDLEYGVPATEGSGALWRGNEDPLGHEFWQGIDSTAVSGVAAQLLKYAFSRARPYQNEGPTGGFRVAAVKAFPVAR